MAKPVSPQEMFDAWQKLFAPGTMPMGSLMFPVLDPAEIEKKIGELQVVEHWLRANLGMLQMSIKSLEYQRSMLKGGEKANAALADASPRGATPNPAQWAWDMMTQPGRAAPAPKKRRK